MIDLDAQLAGATGSTLLVREPLPPNKRQHPTPLRGAAEPRAVRGLQLINEVLAEEPWSYILFRQGRTYLLTYLSGGVVELDYTVELPETLALELAQQPDQLRVLVWQCRCGELPQGVRHASCVTWPAR